MSWRILEQQRADLAQFGRERLHGKPSFLATVRKDGSPRVHPVTPIIGQGRFFVFMEPTSPKGHDLRRDGRFAIHGSVTDTTGASGEFCASGRAHLVDDPARRALAVGLASYTPADRYILFELEVESAASTVYPEGTPVRDRWSIAAADRC